MAVTDSSLIEALAKVAGTEKEIDRNTVRIVCARPIRMIVEGATLEVAKNSELIIAENLVSVMVTNPRGEKRCETVMRLEKISAVTASSKREQDLRAWTGA